MPLLPASACSTRSTNSRSVSGWMFIVYLAVPPPWQDILGENCAAASRRYVTRLQVRHRNAYCSGVRCPE